MISGYFLIFSFAVAMFSWSLPGHSCLFAQNQLKLIGHRGASGVAPENTLAAVKEAFRMNASGVEVDVHLTSDNKVVVIHDSSLQRTAGVPLQVAKTLSEGSQKV